MTIISLHLPKTAGTSFKVSLADHFGDRFRDDYGDQAISRRPLKRHQEALSASVGIARRGLDGVDCVHGHFLPLKYRLLGARRHLTFITWMREPLARMVSHYDYWQESYDERTAAPHHRQVVEERWSLEQFCLSDKFRNIYSQYLWGFALERFAFIGISEYYQQDFLEFSERFLSAELAPQRENTGKKSAVRREFSEDFLAKARSFHAADMRLYERALELRRLRLAGGIEGAKVRSPAQEVTVARKAD